MKKTLINLAHKRNFQLAFTFLFVLTITLQKYLLESDWANYTGYNNYMIFKQSFFHLIEGNDLYQKYPSEHYDLFKYSPTFALLMGALAFLPNFIGLFFWNLLNVFVLFLGLKQFKFAHKNGFIFACLFVLIELITTTQNSQSNALIAGLILLAFSGLQSNKYGKAAFYLVSTVFIKLFGLVAFALFLFFPKKLKSAGYSVLWIIILGVIPLITVTYGVLEMNYLSWLDLLKNDHSNELKFSVMGFLNSWFGVEPELKNKVMLVGVVLFSVPLIKISSYSILRFKELYLASILLWVVLFNHMAESATFIIAVSGVAVWFFTKKNPSSVDKILLVLVILFTLLSPSDIYPASLRNNVFIPYTIKVIPCILVWIKINVELFFVNEKVRINS